MPPMSAAASEDIRRLPGYASSLSAIADETGTRVWDVSDVVLSAAGAAVVLPIIQPPDNSAGALLIQGCQPGRAGRQQPRSALPPVLQASSPHLSHSVFLAIKQLRHQVHIRSRPITSIGPPNSAPGTSKAPQGCLLAKGGECESAANLRHAYLGRAARVLKSRMQGELLHQEGRQYRAGAAAGGGAGADGYGG